MTATSTTYHAGATKITMPVGQSHSAAWAAVLKAAEVKA
jgi:hypothetical protein